MIRFKAALATAALGLLTLTACGEQVQDVTDAAGDATDTAGEVTGTVTDKAGEATGTVTDKAGEVTGAVTDTVEGAKDKVATLAGLPGFTSSANATLDAVKAGDFETAKTEVANLQESWSSISDEVQQKAPDVHTKVEEGISSVSSGLEGGAPDTEQLTTTINDMIASVKDVAL